MVASPIVNISKEPAGTAPTPRGFLVRRIVIFFVAGSAAAVEGSASASTTASAKGSATAVSASAKGSAATAVFAFTFTFVFIFIFPAGLAGAGSSGAAGSARAGLARAGAAVVGSFINGRCKVFKKVARSKFAVLDSSIIVAATLSPFPSAGLPLIFISNCCFTAGGLFIFNLAKRAAAIYILYTFRKVSQNIL